MSVSAGGGGSGESGPAGHRTAQQFTPARTRLVNITRWLLLVLQIYIDAKVDMWMSIVDRYICLTYGSRYIEVLVRLCARGDEAPHDVPRERVLGEAAHERGPAGAHAGDGVREVEGGPAPALAGEHVPALRGGAPRPRPRHAVAADHHHGGLRPLLRAPPPRRHHHARQHARAAATGGYLQHADGSLL